MQRLYFLLFTIALLSASFASGQGILDSIVSQGNQQEKEQEEEIRPSYPYYKYRKDSIAVANLHDSIARGWTNYDTLPAKKSRVERFSRSNNKEYLKPKKRPVAFTIIYLVLLLGISIYWMFFRSQYFQSLTEGVRSFAYKERFIGQLTLLDFNTVFIKSLSLLIYGLVLSLALFKLKWVFIENLNIQVLVIFLIVLFLAILKYFFGLILASLFQSITLIRHHFLRSVIYDSIIFCPLLISIGMAYFVENQQVSNIFYIISFFLISLKVIISLVIFGFFSILEFSDKKLFVIFYLLHP